MYKSITILAVLIIAFACVEANRSICRPMCRKNQHSPVRCVRDSATSCRKMRQCSIDEENCGRRLMKRPRITSTSLGLCRNIKGHVGSGRCAVKKPKRKTRSTCVRLNCDINSSVRRCYRSKNNNCYLLTECQVQHLNCRRGWSNALTYVDPQQCAGMRPGQRQRCRTAPRTG